MQQLKNDADVTLMRETLVCSYKVEFICRDSAQFSEYVHFYLTLLGVAGQILEDLKCNHFMRVLLPAADNLAECATTYRTESMEGMVSSGMG